MRLRRRGGPADESSAGIVEGVDIAHDLNNALLAVRGYAAARADSDTCAN